MKQLNLLTKTTIVFLILALAAFGIGSLIAVRLFSKEVQKETEFSLIESYFQIAHALNRGVSPDALENDKIKIQLIDNFNGKDTQFVFSDTLAMHSYLKRNEEFRKLTTIRSIGGRFYRVSIIDVFFEADDIEEVVMDILTNLFLVLGSTILLFSFAFSKFLFKPFHQTLYKISRFNLRHTQVPEFSSTSTQEFSQLNEFLRDMLHKIKRDYHSLKDFSENASHELQTPIAVAKGKLELLLETPGLSAEQLKLVQATEHALSKLSRMSEALLLLTKIENREFTPGAEIDFSRIIKSEINTFQELAELKGLRFHAEIDNGVLINIDEALAHILLSNLLKNAVRHNSGDGWIRVRLSKELLIIENSGSDPGIEPELLFERFRRINHSEGSLGLGLSIVRKICEAGNMHVNYAFQEGTHRIVIRF